MRQSIFRLSALALFIAVCGSACTSIQTNVPVNRFESSEALGETLDGNVHLAYQGASEVLVVPSFTAVPPVTNNPQVSRDRQFSLGTNVGLVDRFDIMLDIPGDAPWQLGVKFQFLGSTEKDAKAENVSASITASVGTITESATDKQEFNSSGVESKHETTTTIYDFGLIAGYRLNQDVLFYGGPFYSHVNVSGEITQPADSSTVYKFSGVGDQWGLNVGAQLTAGALLVRFEQAWAKMNYEGRMRPGFHTGLQAGYRW